MKLGEALQSADAARRAQACAAAANDPSAVVWIEAVAECLADADDRVRTAASAALVAIGEEREHEVAPALKRLLRGEDPRGRFEAAFALARLGPPEPALIPPAVGALGEASGSVRWRAARLLVELARLHPEVPRLLLGLARSGDSSRVQRMALFCLRELAPGDAASCAVLLESAQASDPALRRAAFTALGGVFDPPPEALDELERAARADPDRVCRELAARALGELRRRVTGAPPP